MQRDGVYKKITPWQRLAEWEQADKGHRESTNAYITGRLKEQWPGNYIVVRYEAYDSQGNWVSGHRIVFDDPAEETMFRLRWS